MNIRLGDLKVGEIETRLGVNFPDDIKNFMNNNRQENASNIKPGKWHCFDLPFELVCGDLDTATKIYNSLKDKSSVMKSKIQISIQQ